MSDNTLDKFMADVRAIEAKIDELTRERDTARDLACRLMEQVENTRRPTDDSVRLAQVAAILNRYLGEYLADEVPPPSLLRALAIAERSDA